MLYDGIMFDLDGTLWDCTETSAKVWNELVKKYYPDISDEITAEVLKQQFGKPLREIGIALFQSVSSERAVDVVNDLCRKQGEYIAKMGGTLYPELESTLKELSEHCKLFIISNCEDGYIESFFEAHGLGEYFTDYECPGRSGLLKADNIKLIVNRNGLKNPVYVGDTALDAQSAKEAGVPFIFASYGYGTVEEYVGKLTTISDLVKLLDED